MHVRVHASHFSLCTFIRIRTTNHNTPLNYQFSFDCQCWPWAASNVRSSSLSLMIHKVIAWNSQPPSIIIMIIASYIFFSLLVAALTVSLHSSHSIKFRAPSSHRRILYFIIVSHVSRKLHGTVWYFCLGYLCAVWIVRARASWSHLCAHNCRRWIIN